MCCSTGSVCRQARFDRHGRLGVAKIGVSAGEASQVGRGQQAGLACWLIRPLGLHLPRLISLYPVGMLLHCIAHLLQICGHCQ